MLYRSFCNSVSLFWEYLMTQKMSIHRYQSFSCWVHESLKRCYILITFTLFHFVGTCVFFTICKYQKLLCHKAQWTSKGWVVGFVSRMVDRVSVLCALVVETMFFSLFISMISVHTPVFCVCLFLGIILWPKNEYSLVSSFCCWVHESLKQCHITITFQWFRSIQTCVFSISVCQKYNLADIKM